MHSFLENLKKKGPGGVPIWAYAAGTVAVLYLGYRFLKGRGGSSASSPASSATQQDQTPVDAGGSNGGTSPDASTDIPDSTTDTAPLQSDTTPMINGPIIGALPPAEKKKAHKAPHDHKQGVPHTKKKALHRRRPGRKQAPHAHAPKHNKKPHSHEKAKQAQAIPTGHPSVRRMPEQPRNTPPVKNTVKVAKIAPSPVKRIPEQPRIEAKGPPHKQAARRKR